jgi:hypothetical protein
MPSRMAVIAGINQYPPGAQLTGCVNDAEAMEQALRKKYRFDHLMLTDRNAHRNGIVNALLDLVSSARKGDALLFTYSGHGTYVRDLDGDEGDGFDEALVPVDYQTGLFLTDDDLRAIFDQLPKGVTLTALIDCCHSGTITRMLGVNATHHDRSVLRIPRYLPFHARDRALEEAHVLFRARPAGGADDFRGSGRPVLSPESMNHATVSACLPQEVAYESHQDGETMGDFTRAFVRVMETSGSTITLGGIVKRTIELLGASRWQTPMLDSPAHMARQTLVRKTT